MRLDVAVLVEPARGDEVAPLHVAIRVLLFRLLRWEIGDVPFELGVFHRPGEPVDHDFPGGSIFEHAVLLELSDHDQLAVVVDRVPGVVADHGIVAVIAVESVSVADPDELRLVALDALLWDVSQEIHRGQFFATLSAEHDASKRSESHRGNAV